MTDLKFDELSAELQAQARARFLDAGTERDRYWYTISAGSVLCRNPIRQEPGEFFTPDEGLQEPFSTCYSKNEGLLK